jgi:hypothetical protein
MIYSVSICIFSFFLLTWILRRGRLSVGLPIAYLFILLFMHVPGAIAHVLAEQYLAATEATAIGIWYTSIGAASFVFGTWLSRYRNIETNAKNEPKFDLGFAIFCLVMGYAVTYGFRFAITSPSIGAVIEKAGGIWVLGVLIGLAAAIKRGNMTGIIIWLLVMSIYPLFVLLVGGFLSFGSTPIFIILTAIAVSTKSNLRVFLGIVIGSLLFFHLFLSYFQNRDSIRNAVWGGQAMESRIESSLRILTDIEIFDPNNLSHLNALDQRLNQNFFVGRAAQRIESGEVSFLYGRSLWEGVLALVPRIVWPDKPVFAGSPAVVMEMTGFVVNDSTTYGVGNVMELYINFGVPSLVIGFVMFGVLFGWLDLKSAVARRDGEFGNMILYFLPAAAMIHPLGSLVELTSGGAAAFLAAMGWRRLWIRFGKPREAIESNGGPRPGNIQRIDEMRMKPSPSRHNAS